MRNTILLILFSIPAFGQVNIIVLDSVNQNGLENAVIRYNDQFTLTKGDGTAMLSTNLPLTIRVNLIGYSNKQVTITEENQRIYLNPNPLSLDEVVVTGQYSPQSAKNSVYKVRTITNQRIQAQGANSVQDVLSNELSIRFSRDNALGTASIKLQGISGQNVKILLDGVPITGRSGVANEVDINQININSIERIEIIEGPMSVTFGADALAGVINLISKKEVNDKLSINTSIHEETVENNYEFFNEGIHNADLSLGASLTNNLHLQVDGRLNKFGGWIGDPLQYTDRDRQWYPKTQYFGSALVRFESENYTVHYSTDYLHETIQNLGVVNDLDPDTEPYSSDQEFKSDRIIQQLHAEGYIGHWLFNPVISYTNYERVTEDFTTYLTSDLEYNRRETNNTTYNTFFFRNTVSNSEMEWGSLQLGLESTIDQGRGSSLSSGNKYSEELFVFASSEVNVLRNLFVRPGIRYGYHSIYSVEPTPSINLKYDINPSAQLRIGYGQGFRVPSLRELYHEFVDANHNIVGNPELTPEYSHNANADLTKKFSKQDIKISLSTFYNKISDRITYFTPQQSNTTTTYLNLEEFQSTGTAFNISLKLTNLQINSGATYIGRSQALSEENSVPEFVFSWEANTNVTYKLRNTKTSIAAFYKYNGPFKDYRLVDKNSDGNLTPELQGINGFHWLDLTVTQPIGKYFTLATGARNLLNLTTVNNNYSSGNAHGSSGGTTSVGYGRSYFLRINYQLTIKNK